MKERVLSFLYLLFVAVIPLSAQELEYKLEMGGGVGASFYMGDTNSQPFSHLGAAGSFLARYNLNPRMCVKADLGAAHISGNTEGQFFPTNAESHTAEGGLPAWQSFSSTLYYLNVQYEYSFWAFGSGHSYKDNRRFTPYILGGAGITLAPSSAESKLAFHIPVGIGVKYKLKDRVNVGLECSVRFTTSDALDVSEKEGLKLNHPYGISASGFKNKDTYVLTQVFISYDLFPKYRKCNN